MDFRRVKGLGVHSRFRKRVFKLSFSGLGLREFGAWLSGFRVHAGFRFLTSCGCQVAFRICVSVFKFRYWAPEP